MSERKGYLLNADGIAVGKYTDDGKGLLTGPTVYQNGKPVGFIDSEYIDFSWRDKLLSTLAIEAV